MWTPEKLKELRKRFDFTQDQFAEEELGVSVETLRHWEQGKGPIPDMAHRFLTLLEKDLETRRTPVAA